MKISVRWDLGQKNSRKREREGLQDGSRPTVMYGSGYGLCTNKNMGGRAVYVKTFTRTRMNNIRNEYMRAKTWVGFCIFAQHTERIFSQIFSLSSINESGGVKQVQIVNILMIKL